MFRDRTLSIDCKRESRRDELLRLLLIILLPHKNKEGDTLLYTKFLELWWKQLDRTLLPRYIWAGPENYC